MENNQQNAGPAHTTESTALTPAGNAVSATDKTPVQQLTGAETENSAETNEHHSESSKPEGENETLGTP
ncbi:MAG TPA: hypothetical protein VM871_05740 [Flavisolibacter sp.]|jgi:hypothetical protein|nr:hypothetical protein [Flavisolibacter sp.]